MNMSQVDLKHIQQEIRSIKNDVVLIKNILAEEGELTEKARKRLIEARKTKDEDYIKLEELD